MDYGETVVLSAGTVSGPASLVSKEPGELATIYLKNNVPLLIVADLLYFVKTFIPEIYILPVQKYEKKKKTISLVI